MSPRVPFRPPYPSEAAIRSGSPVTHSLATSAELSNWNLGAGAMLIPLFAPCEPGRSIAAAANKTFRFWIEPRYAAVDRIWIVRVRSTDASSRDSAVQIEAPASGGTARTYTVAADRDRVTNIVYLHRLSAQSATAGEVNIKITVTGSYAVMVESIGCYEVPRARLAQNSNEYGMDLETLQPRTPVFAAGSMTGRSYEGLARAVAASLSISRRAGMVMFATPDNTTDARAFTAAGYTSLLQAAVEALGRKLYRESTTRGLKARFLLKTDVSGTTGNLRINTTSGGLGGANAIATGLHAAFAWWPNNPIDFTVACEDLAAADGRRGAAWDDIDVQVQTGGSGTIYIAAACIYESTNV